MLELNDTNGNLNIKMRSTKEVPEAGVLSVYNKNNNRVVTLQANKNHDGMIGLFDRYSDLGWAQTGKVK